MEFHLQFNSPTLVFFRFFLLGITRFTYRNIIYLFKVNNRKRREIYSQLTIKTPERRR